MFLVLWKESSKEDGEDGKELRQDMPGVCMSKYKNSHRCSVDVAKSLIWSKQMC